MQPWQTIVVVMLATGAFAGVASAAWSTEGRFREVWMKHILIGVLATFTVPLFLETIASNLITTSVSGSQAPADVAPSTDHLLVFAGLCLLVGYYAPSYLQRLLDRVLDQLRQTERKAENAEQKVNALLGERVEPELEPEE